MFHGYKFDQKITDDNNDLYRGQCGNLCSQATLQSWPKMSPILKFHWPKSGLQYCTKTICSFALPWTNIGPMDQYI